MKATTALGLIVALGLVTLALVVGLRLNEQGNAFTLGLLCGLAASLPASLIAHYLGRAADEPAGSFKAPQPAPYPQVIIVSGQPQRQAPLVPDFPPLYGQQELERAPHIRVIGQQ